MKRRGRKGRLQPKSRTLLQSWQDPVVRDAFALVTVELFLPAAAVVFRVLGELEKAAPASVPTAPSRAEPEAPQRATCRHMGVPTWARLGACSCAACNALPGVNA